MIELISNEQDEIECEVCGFVVTRKCSLSRHINAKHEIDPEEYTRRYLLDEIPECNCGCGQKVNVMKYKCNEYVKGHSGGGHWQHLYDKEERERVKEKISETVSETMTGVTKSEEHARNISRGLKEYWDNHPEQRKRLAEKIRKSKLSQSKAGILSENHYVNTWDKKEVEKLYEQIGKSGSKARKGQDPWNKGLTKFDDERIRKYSGKNHPRYKENKVREYDEDFYNPKLRSYLFKRQNGKCLITGRIDDLVLHHIDENKNNSNLNNLIFINRSVHGKLHGDDDFKEYCNKIFNEFLNEKEK